MFEYIKLYWNFTRNDRPIGWFLLFLPSFWIVMFLSSNVYDVYLNYENIFILLGVMMLGSILTRSAFCVWNDYADKDFDKQVIRTENRPLANGSLGKSSVFIAMFVIFLCCIPLLLFFDVEVIYIIIIAIIFSFIYPFVKRFSNLAQFWLGLTFNIVIFIAGMQFLLSIDGFEFENFQTYIMVEQNLIFYFIMFYIIGVIWTIVYDTIYAFQDIEWDKKCGVKSTAILFEHNYKYVLGMFCIIKFLFFVYFCVFFNFDARNHLIFNGDELFFIGKMFNLFFLFLVLIGEFKIIYNVKFGDLKRGGIDFEKHALFGFITGALLIL